MREGTACFMNEPHHIKYGGNAAAGDVVAAAAATSKQEVWVRIRRTRTRTRGREEVMLCRKLERSDRQPLSLRRALLSSLAALLYCCERIHTVLAF